MDNQQDLWKQVNVVKRDVQQALGANLSYEFRSSNVFQAYTALCGEAVIAYHEDRLDAELVAILQEYADKVIARGRRVKSPSPA